MRHRLRHRSVIAAALALPLLASAAQAGLWGFRGGHFNDTGGIIPWSPDIAGSYREIAAEECARFNKLAVITSVHPVYGDFIGFACVWPRDYDPYKTGWHWPF